MMDLRRPFHRGGAVVASATLGLSSVCAAGVRINEIQSSNLLTIKDENGDPSDWVELFNDGPTAVNLQGWGLSDNLSQPMKWTFGAVTMQPGQFLLVWASGKNRPSGPQVHTSWSISSTGEPVLLTQPDGTRVDEYASIAVARDTSLGRKPDATGPLNFFAAPTPGAANTTVGSVVETLAQPSFSVGGGMYTAPVSVAISSSVAGGTVRYTLDGSDPTESSPAYAGPISLGSRAGQANVLSAIPTNNLDPGAPYYEGWQAPAGEVFKINVLRARVFRSGALPSRITTQSYLVDPLGTARYAFPVVSISTTPANLFDGTIGIYVPPNYSNEGSAWERPGHLEFYERGGALAFQGEIGMRIHGNTTVSRPRKALRIYSRNPAGASTFAYRIFPEKEVDGYDTFLLRASGNDWGQTIFRDALVSDIAAPTGLDRMCSRPVVVFIDGEYWGLHNLRDRVDEGYHFHHYGLGENDYTQLEIWSGASPSSAPIHDRANPAMLADFQDILARAAANEFATASGYASLEDRIDVGNFIDYSIHEIWCGNTDWPGNNVRLWRKVVPDRSAGANARHDGRWRWILYDADFALGLNFSYVPGWNSSASTSAQFDSLAHATALNGSFWSNNEIGTRLLRKCLDNATFRARFALRACDLLNTTLSAAGAIARLDAFVALYAPGMTEHVARWRQPFNWQDEIARVRSYLQARPAAVFGHMTAKFGLAGTASLTVQVDDQTEGVVKVNSILLDAGTAGVSAAPYPWTGTYLRGVPMQVTAMPRAGHRFVRWVDSAGSSGVSATEPQATLLLSGARTLRAEFEPVPCASDVDGNGEVDFGDVALMQLDFGACPACASDLDGDGQVDFADVALLLLDYGPCP